MTERKRLDWIDCTKGLVILLVVVGHTVGGGLRGKWVKDALFSFHMPFFFIVSGMTFRPSDDREALLPRTRRSAIRLLTPILGVFALRTLWELVNNGKLVTDASYWQGRVYAIINCNCQPAQFGDIRIRGIGYMWFLAAMFIVRTAYDVIHCHFNKGQTRVMCVALGLLGYAMGQQQHLPWSLDVACFVLPLFAIGHAMKEFCSGHHSPTYLLALAAVWLLTFSLTYPEHDSTQYLDLASRVYPFFPLCMICAVAGTLAVVEVGRHLIRVGRGIRPLLYLGKHTMAFLTVHALDDMWRPIWFIPEREFMGAGKRILADTIVFCILMMVTELLKYAQKKKGGSAIIALCSKN